jgi:hypothetical protein
MDSQQKQRKRYRRKGVRERGPAQRKIGRPIQPGERLADKFDKTDVEALVHDVAMGVPLGVACGSVGISEKTFQNEEFLKRNLSKLRRFYLTGKI